MISEFGGPVRWAQLGIIDVSLLYWSGSRLFRIGKYLTYTFSNNPKEFLGTPDDGHLAGWATRSCLYPWQPRADRL